MFSKSMKTDSFAKVNTHKNYAICTSLSIGLSFLNFDIDASCHLSLSFVPDCFLQI